MLSFHGALNKSHSNNVTVKFCEETLAFKDPR